MAREVRIEDHTVKEGEPSEKYIGPKKAQSVGEVTVNVNVDVSEALTCLKALQREAHEATEALRELEEAAKSYGKSTKESLMNIADTLARLSIEMDGKEVVDVSTKGHIDISAQFDLSGVSTKQLTDELAKREGVTEYYVEPHAIRARLDIDNGTYGFGQTIEGPARIIVNKD